MYKTHFFTLAIITCNLSFTAGTYGQSAYEIPTEEISFKTPDGITLFGDLAVSEPGHQTILLFHQGRSNVRGEYGYTLPRLHNMGYNVMAVDLRTGGNLYGSENRSAISTSGQVGTTYCDAEKDIRAAIDFARSRDLSQLILLGSSFSGSLVIRAAAKNPQDLVGIIAFSPSSGGPMASCKPDDAIRVLNIPLLVFRPKKEMEIESVANQSQLIQTSGYEVCMVENGVHGSSLLVPDRVKGDVQESWDRLKRFLEML